MSRIELITMVRRLSFLRKRDSRLYPGKLLRGQIKTIADCLIGMSRAMGGVPHQPTCANNSDYYSMDGTTLRPARAK